MIVLGHVVGSAPKRVIQTLLGCTKTHKLHSKLQLLSLLSRLHQALITHTSSQIRVLIKDTLWTEAPTLTPHFEASILWSLHLLAIYVIKVVSF